MDAHFIMDFDTLSCRDCHAESFDAELRIVCIWSLFVLSVGFQEKEISDPDPCDCFAGSRIFYMGISDVFYFVISILVVPLL